MKGLRVSVAVLAAAGTGLAAGHAGAAGFALKEQSASALGNAFAGATAKAGDISYMFYNPAGLTRHSGTRATAGLSYVAPTSEPERARASTLGGTVPIRGGDGGDDISENAVVPTFYAMHSVTDRLKLGLGVNVPFGLETKYDSGWAGRYHAVKSKLQTININPNVAYEVADGVSLGAGVQVQYIDAELSRAIDFGTIGQVAGVPGARPTQQDGAVNVTGDDWGVGANLGVLVEPMAGTRLGLAYRSRIAHELRGRADFQGDSAGVAAALRATTGRFTDTGGRADLTTPDLITGGFYHEVTDRWAVMGEVQYTLWSTFDELRVRFGNPAQPDSVTREDWEDSWFGALGATFTPRDDLALRAGAAYDETPIPDRRRTPRIPGADRYWLAIGAHYAPYSWLTLDAGYTHIFVDDSTVTLRPGAADPRGDLALAYDNSIDIATVQVGLRF